MRPFPLKQIPHSFSRLHLSAQPLSISVTKLPFLLLNSRTYLSKRQKLDAIRSSKPSFEPKKTPYSPKKAFIREDQDDDYEVTEDWDDSPQDAKPRSQTQSKGNNDWKSSREIFFDWSSKEGQSKKIRAGNDRKKMEEYEAIRGIRIDTSSLPLNDRKALMDSKSLEAKVQNLLLSEPWKIDNVIGKLVLDGILLKPEVWGAAVKVLVRNGFYPQAKKLFEVQRDHKLRLAPKLMTSIFDDIAFSVGKSKGDARAKSDRLHEAAFFWDSIQSEATIFHVNAYLKVCLECAGVGGWERAWNLFESLGDPLAKKADAPEDAMEAHMQRLYPSSITFTMMLKLCSRSGLQSAMDCGLQLWSEIRKIVKADKSKNPAKIKIDGPMLNAVLGLFARAPSDADAVKGLQVVEEFYGLPIKHSDPIESPSTKRFIDIRTLTLLIQFATRLKYPELGLVWFEIVDKAAQDKKVQIRDEGLYKCVAGLLLPARQHDKLQALLDQDPKAPFEVTLRNCAAAVHSASWKDKNKWWTRAEEAAMKFGWDNLRFNDVLNFLEVSVLTGHHREGARLAIQRKKDIIQWSHDQLDKALTRRTQNPNLKLEDSDNVLDLKLLKLVQLICSKKEDMLLSKEKGVFLELLEKQVKQILDDWESITSKTKVYLEKDDEIDDGTPPKHRGERREFKKSAATNRKQQDSEKDVDRSSEEDPQVALRRRQFLLKASRQRE